MASGQHRASGIDLRVLANAFRAFSSNLWVRFSWCCVGGRCVISFPVSSKVPTNRLALKRVIHQREQEFHKAFEPIIRALAAGDNCLIFCINGKNSSAMSAAMLLAPFCDDTEQAKQLVHGLRNLFAA